MELLIAYLSSLLYGLAVAVYGPTTKENNIFALHTIFSIFGAVDGLSLALLRGEEFSGAIIYAILASIIGGYIGGAMYLFSIKYSGPTVASTSVNTYVLLTPLVNCVVFSGVCITAQDILAIFLVFLGLALLGGRGGRPTVLGISFGIGAASAWSFSANLLELSAKNLGVGLTLFVRSLVLMALAYSTWHLTDGRPLRNTRRILVGGFLDNGVSLYLYILTMQLVNVVYATVFISLYPIHAMIFSRVINGERLPKLSRAGALMSVLGVVLYVVF